MSRSLFDLGSRTALLTGGASGIGRQTVHMFAELDAIVYAAEIKRLNVSWQNSNSVITLLLCRHIMQVTIRQIGNSQGFVMPKPLLVRIGLAGEAE